ncbi:MAG: LysM peptidoglycan-binding domain-containing protein, partial [Proteobacteria bacterium]|nr:LysM peptidoglycan-binding domain-containing protein [Pseudomonadota bacterium]
MPANRRHRLIRLATLACLILVLSACGSGTQWRSPPKQHIVRAGETLYSIAWRYNKNPTDVARWNRLGDGSLI